MFTRVNTVSLGDLVKGKPLMISTVYGSCFVFI